MDPSIRLGPADLLDYNGIIFSHYGNRQTLEPFFAYISDQGNHMCGAVPVNYVTEAVRTTTHAFIAWVKHDGPEQGRIPVAYALFAPDASGDAATIVLQLVCSRPLTHHSERDAQSEAFWRQWRGFGDLEYEDDPAAAFEARGRSYADFRAQWAKVCSYSNERRALVLGLGVIIICEAMTYFLSDSSSYKHMRLEAAARALVPYYARMGFQEAAVGTHCLSEQDVIDYLSGSGSSTTPNGSTNMLLCDMRGTGQPQACEWAKRYMQREFCHGFWDAIRHSAAWEEARVYSVQTCIACMTRPAALECAAPGCGGPEASYCSKQCQRTHWVAGQHALVCGSSSGGGVSRQKAREILHHGSVRGHPLTERQKRFFGWKMK